MSSKVPALGRPLLRGPGGAVQPFPWEESSSCSNSLGPESLALMPLTAFTLSHLTSLEFLDYFIKWKMGAPLTL